MTITADELERRLAQGDVELLDVRTKDEYEGAAGYPCDPRQGHIAGAVHLEWQELYANEGTPLNASAVRRLLVERGIDPDGEFVAYCHSGQRSAMAVAALRAAGFTKVRNYEGSWHEWSRRESRRAERS